MNAVARSLFVPWALLGLFLISCAEADAPPPPSKTPEASGPELVDRESGRRYRNNPNRRLLLQPQERLPAGTTAFFDRASGTDWSGTIAVQIAICNDEVSRQHNLGIACSVDPDFVLTGGGASANFGQGPGALLIESRPLDSNLATWVASSKDHLIVDPHTLTVYAVGIRLEGVSHPDLKSQMQLKRATGPLSSRPTLSATVDSDFMLVGGGVSLLNAWGSNGVLLTGSFPSPDWRSWVGSGKDHVTPDSTQIQVFAIGIRPSIPFFGNIARAVAQRSVPLAGRTGVGFPGIADVGVTPGMVPVGAGAVTDWAPGQGRLLFAIEPSLTAVTVWDKDHYKSDPDGTLTAFVVEMWKTN
jgi:hypothetical protein